MNSWTRAIIAVLAPALAASSPAASPARADVTPVTSEQRREVVDGLVDLLDEIYVIPETADAMIARLRSDLESGRFDSETEPSGFAATLTRILREMSGDMHLRVSYGDAGAEPAGAPRVVRRAPGGGARPGGLSAVEPFPRAVRNMQGEWEVSRRR
jgi:hypothetical protein